MSRRAWLVIAGVVATTVVVAVLFTRGRNDTTQTTASPAASTLPTRTFTAGAVTVKIEAHHIDPTGAEFKIAFDTHSTDLGFDVARASRLTVNGNTWTGATWSGDGAGGHHRAGTLKFASSGPATGDVDLELGGLPQPVKAQWTLTDS